MLFFTAFTSSFQSFAALQISNRRNHSAVSPDEKGFGTLIATLATTILCYQCDKSQVTNLIERITCTDTADIPYYKVPREKPAAVVNTNCDLIRSCTLCYMVFVIIAYL